MNKTVNVLISLVSVSFLMLAIIPSDVSASDSKIKCSVIKGYGIDASFGFDMKYSPSWLYAKTGQNIEIAFSPTPGDVSMKIDFGTLLLTMLDPSYESEADSWATLTMPLSQTPLGVYPLGDFVLTPYMLGTGAKASVTVTGQINGTVHATGLDDIDGMKLIWTEWGAQTLAFEMPNNEVDITVSFVYYVKVTVKAEVTFLWMDILDFDLLTLPLPEAAFTQSPPVSISIVPIKEYNIGPSMHLGGYDVSYMQLIAGLIIGLIIGVLVGILVGIGSRKKRHIGPLPPTTPMQNHPSSTTPWSSYDSRGQPPTNAPPPQQYQQAPPTNYQTPIAQSAPVMYNQPPQMAPAPPQQPPAVQSYAVSQPGPLRPNPIEMTQPAVPNARPGPQNIAPSGQVSLGGANQPDPKQKGV